MSLRWVTTAVLVIGCGSEASIDPDAIGVADGAVPDAFAADAAAWCAEAGPCPAAGEWEVSVCGTIYDAETGDRLSDDAPAVACSESPGSPACAVRVTIFDTGDPTVSGIVAPGDTCGRFQAVFEHPVGSLIAVVVDNAASPELYVGSSSGLRVPPGTVHSISIPAVRSESDARWTLAAGSPFGADTFADTGTVVFRFEHEGLPMEDVTATVDGNADNAFYFSGTDTDRIGTLDVGRAATGPNGTAFLNNWGVHEAVGSLPANCEWPAQVNGGSAGRYRFQTVEAECN